MSNMHHCRFENTRCGLKQIMEGTEGFTEELERREEHNARAHLIRMMINCLEECGYEIDTENADEIYTTRLPT